MPVKTKSKKNLKKKCDTLWAKIIRSKGYCEWCGKSGRLNAHHAVGRSNHAVRWDLRNGVTLCVACHFKAHQSPLEFAEWFKRARPEDYEYLMSKKNELWDKDYDKVLEYLNAMEAEYDN